MKFDKRLVATIVAVLAAISITVVITDDDNDGRPDQVTITLSQTPAVGDLQPEPEPASKPGVPETTLRDETPDEIPAQVVEAGQERSKQIGDQVARHAEPVGGAQNYSCTRDYSGQVYSSRGGARVVSVKLHYTVSQNLPGDRDRRGIQGYFKRTRIASAHRIVDFEGGCLEMVPASAKAWTQGAFNPTSYSYEIIATGRETKTEWLASPLIRKGKLASMVRDDLRRFGLPTRFVNPVGCTDRPGYTDHNALECGNDHHDVMPNFPYREFQRQLLQGPPSSRPPREARSRCRKLNRYRRIVKAGGRLNHEQRRRARGHHAYFRNRKGLACVAKGAKRV